MPRKKQALNLSQSTIGFRPHQVHVWPGGGGVSEGAGMFRGCSSLVHHISGVDLPSW